LSRAAFAHPGARITVANAIPLFANVKRVHFLPKARRITGDNVYSAGLATIGALPRGAKPAVAYPALAVNFAAIPQVHWRC